MQYPQPRLLSPGHPIARAQHEPIYFILLLASIAVMIIPLVLLKYVPLVDYPSHLVRSFILYHYRDVGLFQRTYRITRQPIPNLACDLVLTCLLRISGLLLAGRVFIIMVVILYAVGSHLLAREIHGRASWVAIPCAFSVYNSQLLYGEVNYVLGLALFMICVAFWLRWRTRWTIGRHLALATLVVLTYLTHLTAYGFVIVSCTTICIWDVRGKRRTSIEVSKDLALLFLPMIMLAIFIITNRSSAGYTAWNSATGKINDLFTFIRTYDLQFDILYLALVTLSIAVLVLGARRVRFSGPLTCAAAIFAAMFLACPLVLLSSSGADARFVPPVILLMVLSIRCEVPKRTTFVLLSAILLGCVLRVGVIAQRWEQFSDSIEEAVQLANAIPVGSKVYPALFLTACSPIQKQSATQKTGALAFDLLSVLRSNNCKKREFVFEHIVEYAIPNSLIYVPTLHAHSGQQPLIFRRVPKYRLGTAGSEPEWNDLIARHYAFVWSQAMPDTIAQKFAVHAVLVGRKGEFSLWQIRLNLLPRN